MSGTATLVKIYYGVTIVSVSVFQYPLNCKQFLVCNQKWLPGWDLLGESYIQRGYGVSWKVHQVPSWKCWALCVKYPYPSSQINDILATNLIIKTTAHPHAWEAPRNWELNYCGLNNEWHSRFSKKTFLQGIFWALHGMCRKINVLQKCWKISHISTNLTTVLALLQICVGKFPAHIHIKGKNYCQICTSVRNLPALL